MSSDERLVRLETIVTEQERTIEELSGQLAEQWKTIETLEKRLDVVTRRFLALEEEVRPDAPVTKPPHW